MKKIFGIILLGLDITLVVSGITCLIVSQLVKGTTMAVEEVLLYGFIGIGCLISTSLVFLGLWLLIAGSNGN